jgi:hypothetical protein
MYNWKIMGLNRHDTISEPTEPQKSTVAQAARLLISPAAIGRNGLFTY